MKDKSKLAAIILSILAIVVLIISMLANKGKENEIKIVTNYSNFYTVNSCLYRTITYISSNDVDDLLLVLDSKYKAKNNINKDNVMELFPSIVPQSSFTSRKMYYEQINENITKYYVYGYTKVEQLYEDGKIDNANKTKLYFIVYLDKKNKTFSIEPYSGEIFLRGDIDG